MTDMISTSASLLERLRRPNEEAAWNRFVDLYAPLLRIWAGRFGLQANDADDLVQEVFATLLRDLPRFVYRPPKRFRGWLWTVTKNKWHEKCRRKSLPCAASAALVEAEVPDGVQAVCEAEYQDHLVRRVAEFLREEFQPKTWQAFWECVVAERSGSDVARELDMTENAVYIAKGRVLRRLRRELDGLLD
jgi:RNA polymerase sigma-70 factor (ECF subfamily)